MAPLLGRQWFSFCSAMNGERHCMKHSYGITYAQITYAVTICSGLHGTGANQRWPGNMKLYFNLMGYDYMILYRYTNVMCV